MAFLPFHENPEVEKHMIFCWENKILTTFEKTERESYNKALEIYKKETGDDNLYILDDTYDIDGSLRTNLSALHYKERKNCSRFWEIHDVLEYKEMINKHKKGDKIEMFLKPTNGGCSPEDHEHIIGRLIDNNEECIKIKSDKNDELRKIKYIDIALIDDGHINI
ncbi:hypothetical protein [Clostridium botulinum]|uniref:hypothetical protein n=1 Tax=Clostridium botulinum TaxID=1491 RepID=UPI0013FFF30B|nr:hypothetical protein [Clostridium botulinum]MBY6916036.1 hypothetical protein [Clostridium botulinum]NFQ39498.1 hypothetical protein [Clostridium botulinum]